MIIRILRIFTFLYDILFYVISDDVSKSQNEAAQIAKDNHLIEDEAPWRRSTKTRVNRTTVQHESPPKTTRMTRYFYLYLLLCNILNIYCVLNYRSS